MVLSCCAQVANTQECISLVPSLPVQKDSRTTQVLCQLEGGWTVEYVLMALGPLWSLAQWYMFGWRHDHHFSEPSIGVAQRHGTSGSGPMIAAQTRINCGQSSKAHQHACQLAVVEETRHLVC